MHDIELDIYARPTVTGHMPDVPVRYVDVPWTVQYFGDRVFGKAPWKRVEQIWRRLSDNHLLCSIPKSMPAALKPDTCLLGSHVLPRCIFGQLKLCCTRTKLCFTGGADIPGAVEG